MKLLLFIILFASLFLSFPVPSCSRTYTSLTKGSSISPQDILVSTPNGIFTAGFFMVGQNSYCFSVWFTEQYDGNHTIVWMANRDKPVNGLLTKFFLQNSGNLELIDGGQITVWTSNTESTGEAQLQLHDNGNLVLNDTSEGKILWQSFDFPTNTLLPEQLFTRNAMLISSRSETNHSSGFYKLYFGSDNVLHLRYEGPDITSVFWPDPTLVIWDAGRLTYNSSKTAVLDSTGHFLSSDTLQFNTSDYGIEVQRRMVMDVDGNLRIYSLDGVHRTWVVTWQQSSEPCKINGICGENSFCTYDRLEGRKCTCIPGYKMKDLRDWSSGCEPDFKINCDNISSGFVELLHVEYPGYDLGSYTNYTFEGCKSLCLSFCECKGFQYKFDLANGYYSCFPKTVLLNGYRSEDFPDSMYIRVPKFNLTSFQMPGLDFNLQCSDDVTLLDRSYGKKEQDWIKSYFWCTLAVGSFEVICLLTYFIKTRRGSNPRIQGYLQVATGFRKFSYVELKVATKNFSQVIGEGGGGVVYKGILADNRVAAIKFLREAIQGEAQFLAEVSTIGRLNHLNLIEIWGYCVEGKHRLLVYEYMEHGSLTKNLYCGRLDWWKRYEIALGIARGLSYLHEECLEWVLHCDVKPENILLNSEYQAKVADFGLSKLLHRSAIDDLKFSRIRGTRGYMAPEWASNLPITSKVDVYSYGIVVLELITGRQPGNNSNNKSNGVEPRRLVSWVKEKMQESDSRESPTPIIEMVDPAMNGDFDMGKMEVLVRVALQCAEEDIDSRPTMKQVVDILLQQL